MSDPITPAELAAMKQRCEAATAGPWLRDAERDMPRLIAEVERLRTELARLNEPYIETDSRITIIHHTTGPVAALYEWSVAGISSGPYRTWREAYHAAESYLDWADEKRRNDELRAELAAAKIAAGATDRVANDAARETVECVASVEKFEPGMLLMRHESGWEVWDSARGTIIKNVTLHAALTAATKGE